MLNSNSKFLSFCFLNFILMSEAIDARQVNSQGPHLSSSNISRKDQTQPITEQQHLLRLVEGLNRFDSLDHHNFNQHQNGELTTKQRYFYQQSGERIVDSNEPDRYLQRNYTDISSIEMKANIGTDISPIRRFENEDDPQGQTSKLQSNDNNFHRTFQSPEPNGLMKNEYNFSSNSVSDYFSRNASSYLESGLVRPQTQRNEGDSTDRYHYSSGNYSLGQDYKKYRVGSQHDTKPHTQRQGDNITGHQSLNQSYKKIANFTATNDNNQFPFIRPYSTFNLTHRPQSFNQYEWNRPVSYQEQTYRIHNTQQNRLDSNNNRNGVNNLTALESEGVIEEDARYMRTYVQRPFTEYQNENQFSAIKKAHTNVWQQANQNSVVYNQSMNLKETNINRPISQNPQQVIFSNISEIKRPYYENQYKEKRQLRKLGGEEQPKVIFKNNWILLALLLLLLLGLISLGVWIGRNTYMQRQKYGSGYSQEIITKQPGVNPTLVDPTQIKHINNTEFTNQTVSNNTTIAKPIEYPPISINITIVNPEIQTRNDTIVKPLQPLKPVVNVSVMPQQIPIVFPPIEVEVSNGTGGLVVVNGTQKPIEKPAIEPTKVPQTNITVNVSSNTTVIKPTNITTETLQPVIEPVIIPEIEKPQTNQTLTNVSLSIQPLIVPSQPTVTQTEPIITPFQPITTPLQPTTPVIAPTMPITNTTVNQFKPQPLISQKPSAEYIEAQPFKDEYQGYEPSGYYYYPVVEKIDYSVEPTKQIEVYPQVTVGGGDYVEPIKPQVNPEVDVTGAGDNVVLPIAEIQFNQTYEAPIINNNYDTFVEPSTILQNISNININESTIPKPTIQPIQPIEPVITEIPTNVTQPLPIIQPTIQPSIIQPTLIPSSQIQPKPSVPSQMTEYIDPLKVSDLEVSVTPIREEVDFDNNKNNSLTNAGDIEIQPQVQDVNAYVTKPEKIQDIYVPSIVEINPTPIQTGFSVIPIQAPIDFGSTNVNFTPLNISQTMISPSIIPIAVQTPKPVQNITQIVPIVVQTPQIVQNISQITVQPIKVPVIPSSIQNRPITTIQPTITQPQTFVTPQPVYPAIIQPSFIEPGTVTSQDINTIDASSQQTQPISPQIVDNYAVEPLKDINLPAVEVNPISLPAQGVIKKPEQPFELKPTLIEPSIEVEPSVEKPTIIQPTITQITPTQVNPQITYPQITPTFEPISPQVIPPQQIPVQVVPQQPSSPQYINPISVSSNQSTTQPIPAKPTEILPTELPPIIQPTSIEPTITPQYIQPSPQLPVQPIQPSIQFPALTEPAQPLPPSTIVISQTNFTDPNEFIINRVKRLTSISSPEVIYEIPQGYDKAQLAEIQKNFLAYYNKTLQQKSPLQIIPLFWKANKDSTVLTENEYPIYYAQNATNNSESTNYLPANFFAKPVSSESQIKETIIEITATGEMVVLQKGSDWPEIEKNMQTYQSSGIPANIFPNIAKHQQQKHRYSLRRVA